MLLPAVAEKWHQEETKKNKFWLPASNANVMVTHFH
jgi:hypothetical protein